MDSQEKTRVAECLIMKDENKKVFRSIEQQIEYFKKTGNQCDGCMLGEHNLPYPSGRMVCEKEKYK